MQLQKLILYENMPEAIYEEILTSEIITLDVGEPSKKNGVVSQNSVWKRRFLAAAVCMGLLCILLAGLTGLLLKQKKQMTSHNILAKERDRLQTGYNNITEERDQLHKETNILKQLLVLKGCLSGWKKFGCSCYYISTEKKTWNESREDCQGRGADLVVINSLEEHAFIKALNYRAWIGLTDLEVKRTWRWVDGTPLTTSYWNWMEPNNYGGNEHCVQLYLIDSDPVKAWNDAPCSHDYQWICERLSA
ncbi:hypothetical protein UPYG_G00049160 [Umbra pygmaea]|uniref:C-type lectin domain-containing protein n=1 Tax=Umbra pygmaea TaxID=75934 RepID=A0ABD0XRG5_UMBPY